MTVFPKYFPRAFTCAMIMATMIFISADAVTLLFEVSQSSSGEGIYLSGLVVLISLAAFDGAFFFLIGWFLAFLPAYGLFRLLEKSKYNGVWGIASGAFLGVLFLLVCAGFVFSLFSPDNNYFPSPDSPDFSSRCAEFAFPMIAAGAAGGYVFWCSAIAGKPWWRFPSFWARAQA